MDNEYSDSFIKKILEDSNSIAIVGASPNKERDSHKVMEYLLKKGYRIFPVNPNESGNMILGQYCFDDLESINKPVDMVDVFRAAEAVIGIAEQSISIGAKVLWTQENIVNKEAAKLAENAGLKVVMNRCPKKELSKSYWTTKTK
jgi:predicted CoA-binding protein